jgi:DNA-binding MarR family transcriptional regulator
MARRRARKSRTAPQHEPPASPDIDLGWLGGTVGFYLRTAQEAAFQAFARRANGADAKPWRFAVLALIDANPGLTQRDLAAALRRNTSSLTPVLDELCRLDYVVRERLEHDRRAYRLALTAAGKASMLELMASAVEHEREIDRLVGRAKRADFIRTLKQIIAGLSRQDRTEDQRP